MDTPEGMGGWYALGIYVGTHALAVVAEEVLEFSGQARLIGAMCCAVGIVLMLVGSCLLVFQWAVRSASYARRVLALSGAVFLVYFFQTIEVTRPS